MGAEQSKGSTGQANKEDLLNQYDQVERIDNDVQVLRHKQTGELVGVREYNLTDEAEFQRVYDSLQPKQALQHPNIIKVLQVLKKKESQLCSTFYKVILVFEYVKNTLHEEIRNRQELQQQFNEDELWNILSQSISGINYLYQSNLNHSNISPSTILITDGGIIKVADPQLLSQLTLYAEALTNRDHVSQETYLSPELLAALFDQEYNPRYNQQRSDVFSLGMTVLQAAILEPLDQAYDYKNCTIDEGFIIQKLLKAKSIYGSNLYNFLSAMVVMKVDDRQDLFIFDQIIQQKETRQADSQQLPSSSRSQETSVQQKQQQVDVQQNQYNRYIQAEPARQSNYNEIKLTENAQTAPAKKEEDQSAWRSPANPNINAPKPRNAASMYRDTGDNGSKIQFIPADSTVQKSAVPDQSGGNAIGQTAETERKQQSTSQQQVSQQQQQQQQYPNSYQTSDIYNQKSTLNAYTSPAYSANTNQNSYTPPAISTYTPPVVKTNIPTVTSTYTTPSYLTPVVSTQNQTSSTTTAVPATVTTTPSVPVSQTQQNTQITTSYTSSSIGNQNPTPSQAYTPPVVPAYTSTYTAPITSVSNTYTTSTTYSVPVPIKADYSIKNYGYEVSTTNNANEQTKTKEVTANNAIVDAPKTNFTYESKTISNQSGIPGVNTYVPFSNQVSSLPNQSNTAATTTTTSYSYQIPNPLTQFPATSATVGSSETKTTNTVVNNLNTAGQSIPSASASAGYSESSKPSSYTYTPITQDKQVSSISATTSVPPVTGQNTSTQQQAATTTFQLNSYTTPISIEEAIKKSAPPPLKNYDDILPASSYTGSSGVYNNLSVPIGGALTTGTYQTSVAAPSTTSVPTIVSTTFTAETSNNNKATTAISSDNQKPHDEIEAILARYRNKPDNQQATSTTTTTTGNTKVDYYTGISSNTVPAADAIKTTTTTTTTSVNVQPQQSSSTQNVYSNNTGFTSDVNKYAPISYQLNPPSDSKPVVDSSSKTQNSAQIFAMTPFESNYEAVSGQFGIASNTIPVNSFAVQSNYNAKNNLEDEKIKKSSAENSNNLNPNNTYVNTYVNSYYDSKAGQQPQQQQYQASQGNYQNNYSSAAFGISSENGQQQQDFYGQQYNQGSQYEGQNDNQEREYVVENYQNDSKYEGEKLNGMRDGHGKFYYQDGGLFDGEWSQNKMHGKGVLSYASGKPAYDGDWIDDKFDGFGILYNENPEPLDQPYNFTDFDYVDEFWVRYEGQFKEDNKEGLGTLYLSNGERFEGQFFQDFVNGQGVFFTMDGQQLQGVWNQNKLVQE